MATLAVGWPRRPDRRGQQLEAATWPPPAGGPSQRGGTRRFGLLVEAKTHLKYQKVKKSMISSHEGKVNINFYPKN